MIKTFTKFASAALVALAVCCSLGANAQANTCGAAIAITDATTSVSGSTVGTNDNGTSGAGTCGTTVGTAGQVWYAFTSSFDAIVTMSTCNAITDFDTKLHVYTGSCGALACVTGNDDDFTCAFSGLRSFVQFNAMTGVTYLVRVGGFSANQGNYQLDITATLIVPGCTDPTACNYDPAATLDDGSCIASGCQDPLACNFNPLAGCDPNNVCTYPGCNDPTACNYNPAAGCNDGSCIASGCTDPLACNYDALAGCDNGSCCFGTCADLVVTAGIFPSEISWSINGQSGGAPFNGTICLTDPCTNTFNMFDAFGDGWDNATYTVSIGGVVIATGTLVTGTSGSANISALPQGCTDPVANNYDPAAVCDNGSCVYCPPGEVLLIFNMYDSFGDGWDNATYSFTDEFGNIYASGSLATGTFGQALVCLAPGCYFLNVTAGIFPAEISWEMADQGGNIIFSGGAPAGPIGFSWAGQTGCVIPGCTDSNCNNYNPFATIDDGSCECPPANDDCANAEPVGCGVSVIGTNEFANADVVPACGFPVTNGGVWYTLVGDGSQVTASTLGSALAPDTRIHVFSGDCNNLECVGSSDDFGGTLQSQITFSTVNGTVYYILVSAFSVFSEIEFQLDITCNTACIGVTQANDDCDNAELQISGIPTVQNICCANPDNSVCLGFQTGYGVWFYMNSSPIVDPLGCGPADTFDFLVTNLGNNLIGMTVYEDLGNLGCTNLVPIACCPLVTGACGGDISAFYTLQPNTDYYFLVYNTDPNACGDISLETTLGWLGCTDNTASNYDPCATIEDGSCLPGSVPANDECANAITINCGDDLLGSTLGSTNNGAPTVCNLSFDQGVWYTATGDGQLWTVSTCGSAIDAHLQVLSGSCGAFTCEADIATDFLGCGFFDQDDATYQFIAAAGVQYYFYISSDSFESEFNLSLDCEPVVPGCTNYAACNYNPAANVEDGSCDYFSCTCGGGPGTPIQLNMFDSFGDGWDNGSYTITDALGNVVASGTCDAGDYVLDQDNFVGCEFAFDLLCLQDGCYNINVSGSIFTGEVSWNIVDAGGNILASGGDPSNVGFSIGGICGCTNAAACNFDPAATVDDGSCCFGDCATLTVTAGTFPGEISWEINGVTGGAPFTGVICLTDPCLNTFNMFDSFGDGWNGATYTFTVGGVTVATGTMAGSSASVNISSGIQGCTDAGACNYNPAASCDDGTCCFENCVTLNLLDSFGDGWDTAIYSVVDASTGVVVSSGTLATGSFASVALCLPTACYEFQVTPGFFPGEISWQIFGTDAGLVTGGAPANVQFSVGGTNCTPGCTEPFACNYDPTAGLSDCSLCEYTSCQGCTYACADNYNPAATIDDGSCVGCEDTCPADFNDDGIVGVSDLLFFIGQYGTTCAP
jgi:hypothetical protein